MTRKIDELTDTQLDAALATLKPPPPSDTLEARVRLMAPRPAPVSVNSLFRNRAVAVAAALVAVALVVTLQMPPSGAPSGSAVTVIDPCGEVPVTELAVSGDVAPDNNDPAEPISLAGLPLE